MNNQENSVDNNLNPFENGYDLNLFRKKKDSVRQRIDDQVKDMEKGESKKINNFGKPGAFRTGMASYGIANNKVFRTQKDVNGDTWILRIS